MNKSIPISLFAILVSAQGTGGCVSSEPEQIVYDGREISLGPGTSNAMLRTILNDWDTIADALYIVGYVADVCSRVELDIEALIDLSLATDFERDRVLDRIGTQYGENAEGLFSVTLGIPCLDDGASGDLHNYPSWYVLPVEKGYVVVDYLLLSH